MRRENEKGRANPMAMSAEERQQMLLTQPVEKIIPKMALPTICSMLITSIYNMADTYFVSQIGTAEATASGTSASAAVGIVFSVMAMIQALAFMFGMGSGTNVSHLLGMGKRKEAEVYSAVGFFSAVSLKGTLSGSPYTVALELNTIRLQPCLRMTSHKMSVLVMLL